ncbi:MAG: hypothetical protein U0Q15_15535 [Kineosporiaceae bacterium]
MTPGQRISASASVLVGLWAAASAVSTWGPQRVTSTTAGTVTAQRTVWEGRDALLLALAIGGLVLAVAFVVAARRQSHRGRFAVPALVVAVAVGVCAGPPVGLLGALLVTAFLLPSPLDG